MSSAHALPASPAATRNASRISVGLSRFAWGVLVYNVAVVLWGAVVRATSSGAGCGDHWPLCNGVVVQTHPRLATLIELAHRMTSGITVIAILFLLVWIFRARWQATWRALPSSRRRCSSSMKRCWARCWFCYGSPQTTVPRHALSISRCIWPILCCCSARLRCVLTFSRAARPFIGVGVRFANTAGYYRARCHPAGGHERDAGGAQ